MNRYSLAWTIGIGLDCRGGNRTDPQWEEIRQRLDEVNEHGGTVTLKTLDSPDIGPQSIQVRSESGASILTLGEMTIDDHNVRSFTNAGATKAQVEILGDFWDARQICSDFSVVVSAFKEFFETGDVSRELLS